MKVTFLRDFDYSPPAFKGAVTIAYKAGHTYTLPHDHAAAAVEVGAAEAERPKPARKRKP